MDLLSVLGWANPTITPKSKWLKTKEAYFPFTAQSSQGFKDPDSFLLVAPPSSRVCFVFYWILLGDENAQEVLGNRNGSLSHLLTYHSLEGTQSSNHK